MNSILDVRELVRERERRRAVERVLMHRLKDRGADVAVSERLFWLMLGARETATLEREDARPGRRRL